MPSFARPCAEAATGSDFTRPLSVGLFGSESENERRPPRARRRRRGAGGAEIRSRRARRRNRAAARQRRGADARLDESRRGGRDADHRPRLLLVALAPIALAQRRNLGPYPETGRAARRLRRRRPLAASRADR